MPKKKVAKKKVAKKKVAKKKAVKKEAVRGITASVVGTVTGKPKKKKTIKKPTGSCFVMMPFKDPFNVYYQSIFKPAIKAAGLKPVLASDLFRPSVIVSDLWQMIQDGKVLLAELTTKNANVFYELGLAHAIGKPVILVSETMDDVPFDLQQLRVLLYDKDDPSWGEKLTQSITNALKETLASPIEAVPGIFRKKVESQAPEQDATIGRIESLEQQMRSLRAQATSLRSFETGPEEDLRRTESWEDFEEWARRWHRRGLKAETLENVIRQSNIFPPSESDEAVKELRKSIS